jgi:hypothetical protein
MLMNWRGFFFSLFLGRSPFSVWPTRTRMCRYAYISCLTDFPTSLTVPVPYQSPEPATSSKSNQFVRWRLLRLSYIHDFQSPVNSCIKNCTVPKTSTVPVAALISCIIVAYTTFKPEPSNHHRPWTRHTNEPASPCLQRRNVLSVSTGGRQHNGGL